VLERRGHAATVWIFDNRLGAAWLGVSVKGIIGLPSGGARHAGAGRPEGARLGVSVNGTVCEPSDGAWSLRRCSCGPPDELVAGRSRSFVSGRRTLVGKLLRPSTKML